jgi:hypothetical protein
MSTRDCALLFSGGTDSTCAAALCAEKFDHVHLLTFEETATRRSPVPLENLSRLRRKFGDAKFSLRLLSTDALVRRLAYHRYLRSLRRHGFFLLATPGFSSLSWHLRAIHFCKQRKIRNVFDGMTGELLHLPGHMPSIRKLFAELYAEYGIEFSSPVIDWPVPPDQRYLDRLIVDRHGFVAAPETRPEGRTTGRYLYESGIFPHPQLKGSSFDHRMQHDCYPFVLYNIFAFWLYPFLGNEAAFRNGLAQLFSERIRDGQRWLDEALSMPTDSSSDFPAAKAQY